VFLIPKQIIHINKQITAKQICVDLKQIDRNLLLFNMNTRRQYISEYFLVKSSKTKGKQLISQINTGNEQKQQSQYSGPVLQTLSTHPVLLHADQVS